MNLLFGFTSHISDGRTRYGMRLDAETLDSYLHKVASLRDSFEHKQSKVIQRLKTELGFEK